MNLSEQFSLKNQVAIITGAAGGLGQAVAQILAQAGANVVLADLKQTALNKLAKTISDTQDIKALAQVCNVAQKKDVEKLIAQTHKEFKRVDILVNCAGILGADVNIFKVTEKDWDSVLNVNLKGTWLMATEVARYMVKQKIKGRIINISSSLGTHAQLNRVPYAASKAGVEHLTRNMAMELVEHGIRVNCLAPGWMATDMVKSILESPEGEKWRKVIPMHRAAEPSELTGALLLLASQASSYMTGTTVHMDGGFAYFGMELPK